MADDAPVFSNAVDMGSIAPKSTMLSQLMLLYAASTLRTHPVNTMATAASITAVTGATGMNGKAITATIATMIKAAKGAL